MLNLVQLNRKQPFAVRLISLDERERVEWPITQCALCEIIQLASIRFEAGPLCSLPRSASSASLRVPWIGDHPLDRDYAIREL